MLRTPIYVLVPLAFSALPSLAQNPTDLFTKAPPDVDEALRARISKFYQAHVDGKPRRAEELVAENSKDFFYNSKKPKFLSFEVSKIDYNQDFTVAKAVVLVETYVAMLGFGSKPMKVPVISMWKVIDGQWYWYIDEDVINTTPFGKMGTPPGAQTNPNAPPPDMKNAPTVESLWQQVKVDKVTVQLKAHEVSSDHVTVTNHMPGQVKLELRTSKIPGLEMALDKTTLRAGEKAVLSFQYLPGERVPRGNFLQQILVQPTNELITLRLSFK